MDLGRKLLPLTLDKLKEGGPFVALRFALYGIDKYRNIFDIFVCEGPEVDLNDDTTTRIVRIRLAMKIRSCIDINEVRSACPQDVETALEELDHLLTAKDVERVRIVEDQEGPDDYFIIKQKDLKTLFSAIKNIYYEACSR